MRFATRRRRQPPAVIIVSLIDILIVLLIFLMVTTTFKDAPALKITLPESSRSDLKPGVNENPPLIVTITTNRPYFYLGKTPITIDRLRTELRLKTRENPQLRLAIRADTEAAYGHIVLVTDAASEAQVTNAIRSWISPSVRP